MEELNRKCFENLIKVKPLKFNLEFYQNKRNKYSELFLSHNNLDSLESFKINENNKYIGSSNLTFKKLKNIGFNPNKIDKDFIPSGIDIFVLGCNNELIGVISSVDHEGYDEGYSINYCAGIYFNPTRIF